jgi:hypothetical protein
VWEAFIDSCEGVLRRRDDEYMVVNLLENLSRTKNYSLNITLITTCSLAGPRDLSTLHHSTKKSPAMLHPTIALCSRLNSQRSTKFCKIRPTSIHAPSAPVQTNSCLQFGESIMDYVTIEPPGTSLQREGYRS